jgi:hypothetical protein
MPETTYQPTKPFPESFAIIKMLTSHAYTLTVLPTTSTDSLGPSMLHTGYINAINLTYALNTSKDLADWFTTLVTEAEDLMLECSTTVANGNVLSASLT